VAIDANPDSEFVSISFQFIPPPNPPFPDAMKREFQESGRKRPKLKEELGEETILTDTAQRAGRPVSFAGNSGEGRDREPPAGIDVTEVIDELGERIPVKAAIVHAPAIARIPWNSMKSRVSLCMAIAVMSCNARRSGYIAKKLKDILG
jgi:hypothetical protein